MLILLLAAPFVLIQQQTSQQLDNIQIDAQEQARTLVRLLNATDELVTEQTNVAMRLMKERSIAMGEPNISGEINIFGREVPNLKFGEFELTNLFKYVDDLSSLVGGTATIFVKSNDDFVRITTNVRRSNESRATGTNLNPNSKAFNALQAGHNFSGVVDILDEPYITRYDPIYNDIGSIIGAYYVGYKVDMKVLREAVMNTRQLKTGFAVVLDSHNKIRFLSSHVPNSKAENLLLEQPKSWKFVREDIPNWGFIVIVAYPLSEARAVGLANSWFVIGAGILLGAFLIIIILWQLQRLIFNPIGADPALAIDVVQRIAAGDLDHDGLEAKPDTLMANVLRMRLKLRDTLSMLRENADRMSLSATVFNHAHDGIFIADNKMHIVEVNAAFTKVTGYAREAVLGNTPEHLGFAARDNKFFVKRLQDQEHAAEWRGETWNRHSNGEEYAVWLDIFAVRDDTGLINNYVCLFSDITERKQAAEEIEHLAFYDSLTHLPNRRLLVDRLNQALASSARSGRDGALLFLDLDHFKTLNDTLGHDIGDALLQQVAERIKCCVREGDTVARLGGDEYVVLLEDLSEQDIEAAAQAEAIGEKILAILNKPYRLATHEYQSTASIGIALFRSHSESMDDLLKHADIAMYQAKKFGRNTLRFFDPQMQSSITARVGMEADLRIALKENQFMLYYQPQVYHNRHITGAEVLLRWQHPERGLVPPFDFIPLAEETGLILPIGQWVLETACDQIKAWEGSVHTQNLQLAVNVSSRQFYQADFVQLVHQALIRSAINPDRLKLELTESLVLDDIADTILKMQALREIGVRFSIDDFGTGHSSLAYLTQLPLDQLKIDQSFIRNIGIKDTDAVIVQTIIGMGNNLGLEVIAEGVETEAQRAFLQQHGCAVCQGYLFSKPVPLEEFEAFLKKG
ncbi:EAL domain-containing protein [Methylotenera sp.]|uniref:bifunctional diguanylate cyclase/phosphodiesterase n=1 Tax=Methylotenera sp. TaxID=2051956 RepID=UPI002732AEE2|nr:EAL domain-containing protein [Methylotenera sp.]MDP3006969.1 EAL domain-containing protein [Methylotenera sp.]MDP3007094.1 EAL domain-containing protein [Methylotenera sp.]